MHVAADLLTAATLHVHVSAWMSKCLHSAGAIVRVTWMVHMFVWEGSILLVWHDYPII